MKIFVSETTSLDFFCKNPLKILKDTNNGVIEILNNNNSVFYVITPQFLKKIFDIQYNPLDENAKKENINVKFAMHSKWTPDKDFIRQAALWGIILTEEILQSELKCFIDYWKAEGCFFYHIQWQQKLARSLQKSRSLNYMKEQKRDITYIPTPDKNIPNGFRGK